MNVPRTSRELLHAIVSMTDNNGELDPGREEEGIALIETYVAQRVLKEAEWWAENIERWFGGHSVVTRERLAEARKQLGLRRMQPAGEANERNFGVKLERQGGE